MRMILLAFLSMTLLAGIAGQADAAGSKQRAYKSKPAPMSQSMRPAPLQSPRGYRPSGKSGRSYDFPRFGSKRWWQLQEDMN